ncbi:hypothetical protein [cf. Phormidesmis sp. LEGE 11477]|uniref:hypothetical protein n=1 Tax=cf. Phormidesmis sp. LEGE 11477 TaxID=1828680 RepID=UPI001882AF8E|nr:hypothetical protein [cf. Phormidesmis sp. LEGE 11477]MBE9065001.1 hypothetical protein [cf. Phormidesmis sp. LEGE 11477]
MSIAAVVVVGGIAIISSSFFEKPDSALRWWGLAFQMVGLITVVIGLSQSREEFGRPSLWCSTRDWFKGLFKKPQPQHFKIEIEGAEARAEAGKVRFHVNSRYLEQRMDQLEGQVKDLWDRADELEGKIGLQKRRVDERLDQEQRARASADADISKRLEEAVIGGIHLELFGVLCLVVGITLATVPGELAVLLR